MPYWVTRQSDSRRQGIPWEPLALLSLEGAKGPLKALGGDWGLLLLDFTFLEHLLSVSVLSVKIKAQIS